MRFYYLTITLLIQALSLVAQPADAIKLSSEQTALIQSQGVAGIQTVFGELGIQIQDLKRVEDFTSEVISSQLTGSETAEAISNIASEITLAVAELALSENVDSSYLIEHASAGTTRSVLKISQGGKIDAFEAIKAASTGSVSGAIQFAANTKTDVAKATSAASSGSSAGAVEITKENNLNVFQALDASASGIISGTILTSNKLNLDIAKSVSAASAGLAEGAIEASVKNDLELISHIKATAKSAGKVTIESANKADIDGAQALKTMSAAIAEGAFKVVSGNGRNIRIFIKPVKDINLFDLQQAIESAVYAGAKEAGFIPIIETPYEDDPSVRRVSPES